MDFETIVNSRITVRQFAEALLSNTDALDKPLRGVGVRSDNNYVIRYGIEDKEILINEYK